MLYGSARPGFRPEEGIPHFENYFSRDEVVSFDVPEKWGLHYRKAAIGVVLTGSFDYRGETGSASAVPGSVIFGNPGEVLSARHPGIQHNHRHVVWFSDTVMEELAGEYGLERARFPRVALGPGKAATRLFGLMQRLRRDGKEAALELAAAALMLEEDLPNPEPVSTADRQRVLEVVRHIERAHAESCSVEELAALGGYTRFRFMRLFRTVTGQSVNQFVIATRFRAAALHLRRSKLPVSEIALDVGFNDLSHFNTSFRAAFGCTPRQMRGRAA